MCEELSLFVHSLNLISESPVSYINRISYH